MNGYNRKIKTVTKRGDGQYEDYSIPRTSVSHEVDDNPTRVSNNQAQIHFPILQTRASIQDVSRRGSRVPLEIPK